VKASWIPARLEFVPRRSPMPLYNPIFAVVNAFNGGSIPVMRVYDPILAVEKSFDARPVSGCCCLWCRCSPRRGIQWTIGVMTFECVFHIVISVARPLWEWTSTATTIFAFVLQDACRAVLLIVMVLCCRALNKPAADAIPILRTFFRTLVVLFGLECFEMFLKFFEVHSVCDAPEVWAARAKRMNATGNPGMSETMCEIVSDLYDFGWGIVTLAILATAAKIVHAHSRLLESSAAEVRSSSAEEAKVHDVELEAASSV